jgi:hypothetical protein
MNIEIKRGTEIQFIDSLNTLLRIDNNEPHIQDFIDSFNIDINELYELQNMTIGLEVFAQIFKRLDVRKGTRVNDAGKFYAQVSQGSIEKFITSDFTVKLIGIYTIWNALTKLNRKSYSTNKEILLSSLFMNSFFALKELTYNWLDNHYNSKETKTTYINGIPFDKLLNLSENQIVYRILNNEFVEVKLESVQENIMIDSILENYDEIFICIDNIIYKISHGTYGYTIEFNDAPIDILNTNPNDIDYFIGIHIHYPNNLNIEYDDITFYTIQNRKRILNQTQEQYNETRKLLNINPSAENKYEKQKARNTFIMAIYSIINSIEEINGVSDHIKQTITGFIAYDMGMIELDVEYLPNDNLASENNKLRKTVRHALSTANKFNS